jgi:hypothetical protein
MRRYLGVGVAVFVVAVALVAWAKSNGAISMANLPAGDSGLSPYDIMIKLKDVPVQTFEDLN